MAAVIIAAIFFALIWKLPKPAKEVILFMLGAVALAIILIVAFSRWLGPSL